MNTDVLKVKAEKSPLTDSKRLLPNQLYKNPLLSVEKRKLSDEIEDNKIRLKMIYVGICGTDLHLVNNNKKTGYIRSSAPVDIPIDGRVIGHEGVGEVLQVGKNVKNIRVGMIVTLESIITCGYCECCKSGKYNQCKNSKLLGFETDGLMGNIVDVDVSIAHDVTNYIKCEKDLKAMACVEPAAVAFVACENADIKPGDNIVIFGGGPIGAYVAMLSRKIFGAREIYIVEPVEFRRSILKKWTDNVYEKADDIKNNVKNIDIIIEASGELENINNVFELLEPNGRVVILGRSGRELNLSNVDHMITNNIKIIGSRGHLGGAFFKIFKLYSKGIIDLNHVITTELVGLNSLKDFLTSDFIYRNCKAIVKLK
ncbi:MULTISPECIES: zinc-dependent alcohol dehydrogenase [Peptoniphilaceae]|uniref:zinc-dependent alcohol dehydrogenase n=1 Tax=Peptoniphilaceae TaxID=1570339 RepID=UPI00031BCA07|nr:MULTISPECIES: alcohol dehydrogenase catalytic domain-containing protein [Peptoniphilaceae]